MPASPDCLVVSLDVGSSSTRALAFDRQGNQIEDLGLQRKYELQTEPGGSVELDPDDLAEHALACLQELHNQLQERGWRADAVGFSAFWHSFLATDEAGKAISPIFHLLDTRSAPQVAELKARLDPQRVHARTGCVLHTSYWPARIEWIRQHRAELFAQAHRWMSFGEYLYGRLFGRPVASTSMLSATGLWQPNGTDFDPEMLAALGLRREQLAVLAEIDQPCRGLREPYRAQMPLFADIPWYPALGDGACNNLGSGCVTPDRFGLMVGTTGAMRAVIEAESIEIPPGLWCYRVDKRRFVLGGALSNGGEVYAWMNRTLKLPESEEALAAELQAIQPGSHGLTVLPLLAGERSTRWRTDARAAINGMSLDTTPVQILYAALESVALRFRLLYDLMCRQIAPPQEVVASGGALLRSQLWTQMIADGLGRPVLASTEPEASARGAAVHTLEAIGAIAHLREAPARTGQCYHPNPQLRAAYDGQLAKMEELYGRLLGNE